MLTFLACASVECGPGTVEHDGLCVPERETHDSDPGTDTPVDDTARSDDTGATAGDDSGGGTTTDTPLQVFLLAGQSNMDGYGWFTGLPPSMLVGDPRVPLYWSGWGEFRDLAPSSQGGSIYFGPEVTFGRTLADEGVPVVLVKHAVGGTDLATYWYPGTTPDAPDAGLGFATFADTLAAAAAELDAAGQPWEWAGFIWMQGESDALYWDMTTAYEANLTYLVEAVRTLTDSPELPVVVGLISTESYWTYADEVRAAQQAVADADPWVYTIETDDLPRNPYDLAHYDGPSTRTLGARFAHAWLEGADLLDEDDEPRAAFTVSSGATDYDFTGTCGWEFTLDRAITVTDLGGYGTTYLYTSADVGIWDGEGNVVVRGNVPSWYDAPANFRDNVWYQAIEPVRLDPGTYRIGIVSWTGDADRYLNDASGSFAEGISYTGGVYAEGYWLTYPYNMFAATTVSFVGPDFLFVED